MTQLADLVFKKGYRLERTIKTEFRVRCPHCPYWYEDKDDFNNAYEVMSAHAFTLHHESVGNKNEPNNKV